MSFTLAAGLSFRHDALRSQPLITMPRAQGGDSNGSTAVAASCRTCSRVGQARFRRRASRCSAPGCAARSAQPRLVLLVWWMTFNPELNVTSLGAADFVSFFAAAGFAGAGFRRPGRFCSVRFGGFADKGSVFAGSVATGVAAGAGVASVSVFAGSAAGALTFAGSDGSGLEHEKRKRAVQNAGNRSVFVFMTSEFS